MFVASQKIVAGELMGEQAGDLAHDVTEACKTADPRHRCTTTPSGATS